MSENVIDPGSPAVGETPAPAAPATPATPPVATPAAATPAASTPPDGYVPSYRLRETREAAIREAQQSWAQREAQIRAEGEQYKKQLQALVGVQPSNVNPEVDAVRQQFAKLYPGLAKMEEQSKQLEQLLERSGDLESQTQHYWQVYGRQTTDRLFTKAAEAVGSPLNEEGKRLLHQAFVGYVQSSPENSDRYSSDPTIVDDFLKAFSSGFIDPARRAASAAIPGRANIPLPQDSPGGALRPAGPPQMKNLDERADAAWALYQQTAKPVGQ